MSDRMAAKDPEEMLPEDLAHYPSRVGKTALIAGGGPAIREVSLR